MEITEQYTGQLAKEIRKSLKPLGAVMVRQNYKGTGSRKARRQLWCRFDNDVVIDLWLEEGVVKLGGVVVNGGQGPRQHVSFRVDEPAADVAKRVGEAVRAWKDGV